MFARYHDVDFICFRTSSSCRQNRPNSASFLSIVTFLYISHGYHPMQSEFSPNHLICLDKFPVRVYSIVQHTVIEISRILFIIRKGLDDSERFL